VIRYVVLLRRADGIDRKQFLRDWLGEHQAMARSLPGVLLVAFHPTVDERGDFDGVGYLDFADAEALASALNTDAARRLRAHTATFADAASAIRVVVDTSTSPIQQQSSLEPRWLLLSTCRDTE
jgi:hypothetical protein